MTITKQEILDAAQKYNLNLIEKSFEINNTGVDFQVVFAKDTDGTNWVLRFPRRKDVMTGTLHEKRILDMIKKYIDFETPNWVIYEQNLIAYKKLQGVPMGLIDLDIKNYRYQVDIKNLPPKFIESVGRTLADLHNIAFDKIAAAGFSTPTSEEIRVEMKQRMQKVKDTFGVGSKLWNRWQNWIDNDKLWQLKTAFIHGDFHPAHILINQNSEVTGVIDWTEGRVNDPTIDFTVFHTILNGKIQPIINAYEKAGGYVWTGMLQHLEELAAIHPLFIAEFAIKSGLEDYAEMAKKQLEIF